VDVVVQVKITCDHQVILSINFISECNVVNPIQKLIDPISGRKHLDSFKSFLDSEKSKNEPFLFWLEHTSITPISSYQWACKKEFWQKKRSLNDTMWYFVMEGELKGWVNKANEVVKIKKGQLILIPRKMEHEFWSANNQDLILNTTHFYANVFRCIDLINFLQIKDPVEDCDIELFGSCQKLSKEYFNKKSGYDLIMQNEIENILICIFREYFKKIKPNINDSKLKYLVRLHPVFEYADKHLCNTNLNISDLSKVLFISEVQLRKIFKIALGLSPNDFLRNKRIENSCYLLKKSELPIKTISDQCGFANISFFYKTFKSVMQQTPSEYRNLKNY
jgi:AraC-like DNA-binding protein/mannose-6-phosphate isomerase-like protein (cupin superfamily)